MRTSKKQMNGRNKHDSLREEVYVMIANDQREEAISLYQAKSMCSLEFAIHFVDGIKQERMNHLYPRKQKHHDLLAA